MGPRLRSAARAARLGLALVALLVLPTGCAWIEGTSIRDWRTWSPAPAPADPGVVRGELRIPASMRSASTGRVVVYLDPIESAAASPVVPALVRVHHGARDVRSSLQAVAVGQPVVFQNEDRIYHQIFSYSGPNRFDVGVAPRGHSEDVEFELPGAVHFYCALHPDESGVVFVTPSPWFTTADVPGSYLIGEVPPGRYRVVAWGDADEHAVGEVTVSSGASAVVDLAVRGR